MIKKILIGLAVIVVGIIIVSRFQPEDYAVERTGTIAAPPSVVFAQITDFHNWEKFNPWRDLDTNMVLSYEGPESGVGAKYHWVSDDAGKGTMSITEAIPAELVKIDMAFVEPMESKADVQFKLVPDGAGTKLTWSMTGKHNFLGRILCVFMDMDKMVGEQYEKGFERMNKAFAGLSADVPSEPIEIVREFNAPREAVWKAWTDTAAFKAWWGGKGYTCPVAKLDPKVGGSYHYAMRSEEGLTIWGAGRYLEVVPMERLSFTDSFADSTGTPVLASSLGIPGNWPLEMKCTVTFTDTEQGTRMVLLHENVPGGQLAQFCRMGWNDSLDKLAGVLGTN